MRKTKVRIVGDPEICEQVAEVIANHFVIAPIQRFDTTPYRYAKSPGKSIYITVTRKKEGAH